MRRMTTNHSHPSHDWFEELCALAAIGELSASEFRELQNHLADCSHCQSIYAEFGRISSRDLGLLATERELLPDDEAPQVNEQQLLDRLQSRAQRARTIDAEVFQTTRVTYKAPLRRVPWRWIKMLPARSMAVAAILIFVAALGGYRLSEVRLRSTIHQMQAQMTSIQHQ